MECAFRNDFPPLCQCIGVAQVPGYWDYCWVLEAISNRRCTFTVQWRYLFISLKTETLTLFLSFANTFIGKSTKYCSFKSDLETRYTFQIPILLRDEVDKTRYFRWEIQIQGRKGYLPNLLERWLLHQIFVYWFIDF